MALDRMRVRGGRRLHGEIPISGAKNAALPMLAATLLTAEPCRLRNVPRLQDVDTMIGVLTAIGAKVARSGDVVDVDASRLTKAEAPYDFVRKMRASVLLLGPLLARHGFARVSLPGGCAIGVRPIDQHLKSFAALGAEIRLVEGYVEAKGNPLRASRVVFDQVTVTGTANAIMAAALAEGVSVFENCACEPEVGLVVEALCAMGAEVEGVGTPTLKVKGVRSLKGFDLSMIPDRIETGTYLVAGALTGGDLFLRGARASDLGAVLEKLTEVGARIHADAQGIRVVGEGPIRPADLWTEPHPGFPTDMQAQLMVLLSLANGRSRITETIFENRFMHVAELVRMGAQLKIDGHTVTVDGVEKLRGAPVMATDLRASASLVLAGLAAEGVTDVLRIYHLDRGYESMDAKLRSVGADIERKHESDRG